MQLAPGHFEGFTQNNAFSAPDKYCLTAAGLHAGEYRPVLAWQQIQQVEAWKTTGDGNWGVDEIWHLRVRDSQGNSFSLNDFEEASFLQTSSSRSSII
jgi:hypothetical protein